MSKITYKYQGKSRPNMLGVEKSFNKNDIDANKINRLIAKGLVEVKPKAKPKVKKKK